MTVPMSEATPIAIVGSGTTGRSWALRFARAGRVVRIFDADPSRAAAALAWVRSALDETSAPARAALPTVAPSLAVAIDGAGYVCESVTESLEIKRQVFREVDARAHPEAILASSSSSLLIDDIAAGLVGIGRCVLAHPLQPPHVIPLVELVGGVQTSAEALTTACDVLRSVAMVPVVLRKPVPGLIATRLLLALLREAVSLVEAGVADVPSIELVVSEGLGYRWALLGPFSVLDANTPGGLREYLGKYGTPMKRLIGTLSTDVPALDASTIEALATGVDQLGTSASREIVQSWRDASIERIRALKESDPDPRSRAPAPAPSVEPADG
jgi:L-gulonate 3-dehydrogenase